eukprot:Platyproteum_vivax@DN6137_c0_g1_i2.p1
MFSKIVDLSTWEAVSFCVFIDILFVASLYVGRPNSSLSEDASDPKVIRRRACTVTIVTITACLIVFLFVARPSNRSLISTLGLQITVRSFNRCVIACFLVLILYTGYFLDAGIRTVDGTFDWAPYLIDFWQWFRNMFFAPIVEELVFRASFAALLLHSGVPSHSVILGAPFLFGIAHAHHMFYNWQYGAQTAIVMFVSQFFYTSLFGAFSTFLLIRCESIYPAMLTHSLCNFLGLPPMEWLVKGLPNFPSFVWYILLATYFAGIVGFSVGLANIGR